MLAVTSYPKAYIDACRTRTDAEVAAYRAVATAAAKTKASAVDALDDHFFKSLTLLLDYYFVHRTRAMEGKDRNPLNEVRMLCNSILRHDGILTADKTIKYKPETSVLKLSIGDQIQIDEDQFMALSSAFFAEIARKFR